MTQLDRKASREARDAFVAWLTEQAEEHATGSRDFGRGFAHAVRVLASANVRCDCCYLPPGVDIGVTYECPDCGARWRRESATSWRAARS